MNLNSPGPAPGFPHRRRTSPPGEITLTRWLRSVTYKLPSGPAARASGWSSPSDFAPYPAMIVNGLGRAGEPAAAALRCPPAGAAAQPTARTVTPAVTTATARRPVILSMVPSQCPKGSPLTVRRCDAANIGAALSPGLWPARNAATAAVPQSGNGTPGAP